MYLSRIVTHFHSCCQNFGIRPTEFLVRSDEWKNTLSVPMHATTCNNMMSFCWENNERVNKCSFGKSSVRNCLISCVWGFDPLLLSLPLSHAVKFTSFIIWRHCCGPMIFLSAVFLSQSVCSLFLNPSSNLSFSLYIDFCSTHLLLISTAIWGPVGLIGSPCLLSQWPRPVLVTFSNASLSMTSHQSRLHLLILCINTFSYCIPNALSLFNCLVKKSNICYIQGLLKLLLDLRFKLF